MEFTKDVIHPAPVTISYSEHLRLVKASRDLEILRLSYMTSEYSIPVDVTKAIFGPKPEKPKPDPTDVAATAAIAAAEAAKTAAGRVQALIDKAEQVNGTC